MDIKGRTEIELEILVATMNRNSLGFLYSMFKHCDISKLHILIINQTTTDCLLDSNSDNIRVINSFEKGLSRSRNLAIKNAIGTICLIADDDVVYFNGFDKTVINAFTTHKFVDLLTFKTKTTEGKPYSNYPSIAGDLKKFHRKVLSIEIGFRRKSIIFNNIIYNEHFGLGSVFEDGENVFFLKDIFKKELKTKFIPEFIVVHKPYSSSDDVTSDRYFFARSAMYYKSYGILAYFYILKLILSLMRKGQITISQAKQKFKVALNGVHKYKQLNSN